MSNRTTKDARETRNAWNAMGRKLFAKRRATYNMKAVKRGISYRKQYEASGSTLPFEDWLRDQKVL
jgi:hypothetical protein